LKITAGFVLRKGFGKFFIDIGCDKYIAVRAGAVRAIIDFPRAGGSEGMVDGLPGTFSE
jgi:hypothetical protein